MDLKEVQSLIRQGQLEEVVAALERGDVNVNAPDKRGWTGVHTAAAFNQFEILKVLLNRFEGDVMLKTVDQSSVLLCAAMNGHVECCRLILQAGCPVNGVNLYTWSPLHYAARFGNELVVDLLLQHGADCEVATSEGQKPDDVARTAASRELIEKQRLRLQLTVHMRSMRIALKAEHAFSHLLALPLELFAEVVSFAVSTPWHVSSADGVAKLRFKRTVNEL